MRKPCTDCPFAEKQYIRRPKPNKYPMQWHDVYAGFLCKKYPNGPFGRDCQIYQNWRIIQKAQKLQKKEQNEKSILV